MRTLILIVLFGVIGMYCRAQGDAEIVEKRNIYNKKGDYYFDRNEYKRAIFYYTLAWQQDTTDYFSILKKAEAYSKLNWYPQAEMCYRIVFESKRRASNVYRLKYALTLLANDKTGEFRKWLGRYNAIVEDEIETNTIVGISMQSVDRNHLRGKRLHQAVR